MRLEIEGQPMPNAGARPIVQYRTVSLRYFSTMGIPLREGRLFTEDDWKVPRAMINETMARRFWPKGDAIGKRINLCSLDPKPCWSTIIGIVGNVHQFGLDAEPTPDVYFAGGWTHPLPPAFAFLEWEGGPRLDGCAAAIGCSIHAIHDGGDHWIVVGKVLALHRAACAPPLLFHGSRYACLGTTFESEILVSGF